MQSLGGRTKNQNCSVSSFEKSVKGKLKFSVDVENSPVKAGGLLLYLDGRLVQQTPVVSEIELDTRNLQDGYHELRFVAIANDLVQTTGRVVLPLEVSNRGDSVELQAEQTECRDTDNIKVTAKATTGESIELRHKWSDVDEKGGAKC